MRKLFTLTFSLLFLFACEEPIVINDELDVTLKSKSTSGIGNPINNIGVEIYPNPFYDNINIQYSFADNCEIYIYNYEGAGKKFIIEEASGGSFDFSNEKDGAYIIEVLLNGVIYREFVIKKSWK